MTPIHTTPRATALPPVQKKWLEMAWRNIRQRGHFHDVTEHQAMGSPTLAKCIEAYARKLRNEALKQQVEARLRAASAGQPMPGRKRGRPTQRAAAAPTANSPQQPSLPGLPA